MSGIPLSTGGAERASAIMPNGRPRGLFDSDGELVQLLSEGKIPIQILGGDGTVSQDAIRLALAPSDVHVSEELPSYLAGYKNAAFIADELTAGAVMVPNMVGQFRKMDIKNEFLAVDVKASRQGAIPEIDISSGLDSFTTGVRVIGAFVDNFVQANATGFDPYAALARRARNVIDLDIEIDTLALLTATASWATNFYSTLAGANQWSDPSSDPIAVLLADQERNLAPVPEETRIYMNRTAINAFVRNPAVMAHLASFKGSALMPAIQSDIGNMKPVEFMLPMIGVVKSYGARYIPSSTPTADPGYVLGKHCFGVYNTPGMPNSMDSINTCKRFRFRGLNGNGFEVREFAVPNRGAAGGRMIVVAEASIEKMTGNNVGFLHRDCVA
jgi:hypothetical protein